MKRRDLFKGLGVLGVATSLPMPKLGSKKLFFNTSLLPEGAMPPACSLIPSETRGPYPLDLSANTSAFRRAINETKTGVPFTLTFTFVNTNNNCAPVANARVDIWHCDKDGVYSGYNNSQNAGTVDSTFCRGIQLTDSNGQVTFTTIYPGWYPGRITHVHFEVYISSVLRITSQVAFPIDITTTVYNSSLYTHGQNNSVTSFAADNVFSDGTSLQMLTLTGSVTAGYTGTLTVGFTAPTTGLIELEPETGGQFILRQNYPNPASDRTTIPFELTNSAKVKINLHDVHGKLIANLVNGSYSAGKQEATIDIKSLGLATGTYLYEITTENEAGVFRQAKVMTVAE